MSKCRYNNAANAASLCASDSRRRVLSIVPGIGTPAPPVAGLPANVFSTEPVRAMVIEKDCALTTQTPVNVELVKAVKAVNAVLIYRTYAHARACIIFFFSILISFKYYKNTLTTLTNPVLTRFYALTNRLTINDHIDQWSIVRES
jgi:hypothetical protein